MKTKKKQRKWLSLFLLGLLFAGCKDYVPKPHAYPRIHFPEKSYTAAETNCPFTFQTPSYSKLMPYTRGVKPCWYDLQYTPFDATLHLSYVEFSTQKHLDSLREDAYKLAMNRNHIMMAEEILEREYTDTVNGIYGMIYDLEGKTATPFNFYITDKKRHYVRGSFYFNKKTDLDSVAPIYDFLRKDMLHAMTTFKFD